MRAITPPFERPSRHLDRGSGSPVRYARWRGALVAAGLCAILAVHVAAGLRGVGFGQMWDEEQQLVSLQRSVSALTPDPLSYYYGGLYQLPGILALAPTLLPHIPGIIAELRAAPSQPFDATKYPSIRAAQAAAIEAIDQPKFRERDRRIFVCLVSLIIVWVFIASHRVSGSPWAALAAAAATGLSWEMSYHGRWIGADALHAQFGALTFAMIVLILDAPTPARQRMWIRMAAVASGLAVSCKVLGVFLQLPLMLAICASTREPRFPRCLGLCLEAVAIAFAVFAVTTPGVWLDPVHYLNDVCHVHLAYSTMFTDDYPNTEPFALVRLAKIVGYLSLALFSPYGAAAVALFGLAIVGAVVGLRHRRAKVAVLVTFGLAYLTFVSRQRVFIARNILVLLPMLAILMSVGISRAAALVRRWRFGPPALALALSLLFVGHARWLWRTASTVGTTTDVTISRDVIDYIADRAATKFYISPSVMALLRGYHGPDVTALHIQSVPWAEADYVVMGADRASGGKTNVPHSATYFASLHANFDYYPSLMTYLDLSSYGTPVVILRKDRAIARGVTDGQ
jgi:hypothetical protein